MQRALPSVSVVAEIRRVSYSMSDVTAGVAGGMCAEYSPLCVKSNRIDIFDSTTVQWQVAARQPPLF